MCNFYQTRQIQQSLTLDVCAIFHGANQSERQLLKRLTKNLIRCYGTCLGRTFKSTIKRDQVGGESQYTKSQKGTLPSIP